MLSGLADRRVAVVACTVANKFPVTLAVVLLLLADIGVWTARLDLLLVQLHFLDVLEGVPTAEVLESQALVVLTRHSVHLDSRHVRWQH